MSNPDNTNKENIPNIEKDGWEAEELAEEATNKEDDEIVREMQDIKEGVTDPERVKVAPVDAETTYEHDDFQGEEE